MGTSGAYGGSPGFKPVRDQTQQWLGAGAAGSGGGGDGAPGPPVPPPGPPDVAPSGPGGTARRPGAGKDHRRARCCPRGRREAAAEVPRTLTGGGRSTARASTAGGRALGGAYGARTGSAAALGELGLDLGELAGLSRYQQAQADCRGRHRATGRCPGQ